jgi:16S rRNA G966 N2-methylase RsmD
VDVMAGIETYNELEIHRVMVEDRHRCNVYRKALSDGISPGDVVLDVGAGSGILSMFAARAGAKRVYAVEWATVARFARKLVRSNDPEGRIRIIHADVTRVTPRERVDLIVSEWLGGVGIDENYLRPLLVARDRWLKPNGRILPERVTTLMAPVWDGALHNELEFWRASPYGLDLRQIGARTTHEIFWTRNQLTTRALMAPAQPLWTIDLHRCSQRAATKGFDAERRFTITKGGRLSALGTWFAADFGRGLSLTNAPGAPENHWGPVSLPLNDTIRVERGTPVAVRLRCTPADPGFCRFRWSARVGGRKWEHHDTYQGYTF